MIDNVRSYQAVARWVLCHQNFIFVLVSTRDYLIVHSLYYGLTFVFVFFGRVAISDDWALEYQCPSQVRHSSYSRTGPRQDVAGTPLVFLKHLNNRPDVSY